MEAILSLMTPAEFVFAAMVALMGGMIKGMVGFGMPMIMITGLSTFLLPELALAGLILPTVASNAMQALRQGPRQAWASVYRFRVFLMVGFVFLMASAQLVPQLEPQTFLLVLGVPICVFAGIQLLGVRFQMHQQTRSADSLFGLMAGLVGGMSGVWGPPTVLYLTALNTPKTEQVRVQGVIYGLGALALVGAHLGSGVLRLQTLPLSIGLIAPAVVGMWLGTKVHDRIDQATFRKATLIILTVAGLNLVRRGLMG
ncbi:sulfite exporter TauE/SafE family protein [Aliisedimentitalea scapharcae]|uniref:Probable membrane transporter protein n=1 Tax=Aliisedimentitalea scapharcae TaxID=1524259 RepID=A0ABZ2XXV0_9RHOB|nr:sulfite exporter TauE/SafE family protein [Rhodobacteraceae bacterium M382]